VSSGTISLLRVWTNSVPINSEKSTTELNGPHYRNWKTSNLTLDLEIQQHLGYLKHVTNIIIWIRDMGCYNELEESRFWGKQKKSAKSNRLEPWTHFMDGGK
jgi:hypothetical protein